MHVLRSCHGIVATLKIDLEEAIELDNLALSNEILFAAIHNNVCRGLFELGVGHLRCDGALPDEVVEFLLLGRSRDGVVADISRTNSLVGLLSALACRAVVPQLEVLLTDALLDLLADGSQSQFAQVDRVGTHIGNQTFFIEPLGQPHGLLDRKAKLTGSLLLESTGREGRSR